MNNQEYIEDRVNDQINWCSNKSTTSKRYYNGLTLSIIVLSASIPVATVFLKNCI